MFKPILTFRHICFQPLLLQERKEIHVFRKYPQFLWSTIISDTVVVSVIKWLWKTNYHLLLRNSQRYHYILILRYPRVKNIYIEIFNKSFPNSPGQITLFSQTVISRASLNHKTPDGRSCFGVILRVIKLHTHTHTHTHTQVSPLFFSEKLKGQRKGHSLVTSQESKVTKEFDPRLPQVLTKSL